jgi:hypothetical protein
MIEPDSNATLSFERQNTRLRSGTIDSVPGASHYSCEDRLVIAFIRDKRSISLGDKFPDRRERLGSGSTT